MKPPLAVLFKGAARILPEWPRTCMATVTEDRMPDEEQVLIDCLFGSVVAYYALSLCLISFLLWKGCGGPNPMVDAPHWLWNL